VAITLGIGPHPSLEKENGPGVNSLAESTPETRKLHLKFQKFSGLDPTAGDGDRYRTNPSTVFLGREVLGHKL